MGENGEDEPKVFIRTLLYGTSEQGQYIQNMFVKIRKSETTQNFNIWAYGENSLVRGSGLFVNKVGVSTNHHFLLPKNERWKFVAGNYQLEVYAETVNNKTKKLFGHQLTITKEHEDELLNNKLASLFFNWAPNTQTYVSHIYTKPLTASELERLL